MNLFSRLIPTILAIVFFTNFTSAQVPGPTVRGWTDPALDHNRLIQNKNSGDGVYKLIGPYKVIGTQFLYGDTVKADLFSTEAKAYNIHISYNTYNQQVEFYSSANPDKPLVKEPGEVDSFTIQKSIDKNILIDLKFIYGAHLDTKEKSYFQEMYKGSQFSLYKRYKSELNYVSSNYIQSELRQFDLEFEYFYYDNVKKILKKIKPNASTVIKEFKDVTDLSGSVKNEEFDVNKEEAMKKAFEILNSVKKGF